MPAFAETTEAHWGMHSYVLRRSLGLTKSTDWNHAVPKSAEAGGEDASTSHKTWRPALFLVLWCLILAPSHSNDFWRQDICYTIYIYTFMCCPVGGHTLLSADFVDMELVWVAYKYSTVLSTIPYLSVPIQTIKSITGVRCSSCSWFLHATHVHVRWCMHTWCLYMIIYIYT